MKVSRLDTASTADIADHIRAKLREIEITHKVRILLAVESGSRAWGFASRDSDYDVRFIYHRLRDVYLSVMMKIDVIETEIKQDALLGVPLDMNGWDLRKALQLSLKSNAVIAEWLRSPIKYVADANATKALLAFVGKAAMIQNLTHHYEHLAGHAWKEIQKSGDHVKLKRYFHALRPALAVLWLRTRKEIPPMNIQELMDGLSLPDDFTNTVHELIEIKKLAVENDFTTSLPVLNEFLEITLKDKTPRSPNNESDLALHEEADELFRSIIAG